MKKILAVLIAALLLTGCVNVNPNPGAEQQPEPAAAETVTEVVPASEPAPAAEEPEKEQVIYDHLTVGGVNPFTGAFSTSLWGNAASDIDIRYLLHGYNLVRWDSSLGAFEIDPSVVSGIVVTENNAGDRTYTMTLYSDLKYSDGTKIDAADYAFSLLLSIAPEVAEIGGNTANLEYILGYEDYINGTTNYLAGVRLLRDDMIAITVSHEYLPFFYELGLLDFVPLPISEIAPDCIVRDGGNGVYIANRLTSPYPVFTAELLKETLLNPETGYITHPSVTSGPYKLVSYDGTKAELVINEEYKGNYAGQKPTIPNITAVTVSNEDMIDKLENGEVDVLNKVVSAEVLQDATSRIAQNPYLTLSNYMRTGLSFISFCCENPLVSDEKTRQAIAMCVDKDGLVTDTVDIYGIRTDGYYGLGQWMYQMVEGSQNYPVTEPENPTEAERKEYEKTLADWEALSLDKVKKYDLDLQGAGRLLQQAGWTLNKDGNRYNAEKDDVRYRRNGKELEALELKILVPEGSTINGALQKNWLDNMAQIGIKADVEEHPLSELLNYYYRAEDRDCAAIVMASNFALVFDPSETFRPDEAEAVNRHNPTGISDRKLYQAAVDMRQTEPDNPLGYCQKWIQFQERFQEVVPMIPLYSNVYFDFYNRILHEYLISSNITWSQAIVGAYLSEVTDEELAAGTEEPAESEELELVG